MLSKSSHGPSRSRTTPIRVHGEGLPAHGGGEEPKGNVYKMSLNSRNLVDDYGEGGLAPEIGDLRDLYYLQLQSTNLIEIPPEIGKLKNLEWLDLSNNALQNLPIQIGQLNDLWWLQLSNNDLERLPNQIGNLSQLEGLEIHNNFSLNGPIPMNLTSLDLYYFYFNGTGLCIPNNLRMQQWLEGIEHVQGTGEACR